MFQSFYITNIQPQKMGQAISQGWAFVQNFMAIHLHISFPTAPAPLFWSFCARSGVGNEEMPCLYYIQLESLNVPRVPELPSFGLKPSCDASVALQPIPNMALPSAIEAKCVQCSDHSCESSSIHFPGLCQQWFVFIKVLSFIPSDARLAPHCPVSLSRLETHRSRVLGLASKIKFEMQHWRNRSEQTSQQSSLANQVSGYLI